MKDEAANCFTEVMKKKLHECGIYFHNKVPYIGGSPDRIVTCSCCKPACLEIKCPYSINHLSPHDPEAKVTYLVKENDEFKLIKTHRYYSQCLAQIAVTELEHSYGLDSSCLCHRPSTFLQSVVVFKNWYHTANNII